MLEQKHGNERDGKTTCHFFPVAAAAGSAAMYSKPASRD